MEFSWWANDGPLLVVLIRILSPLVNLKKNSLRVGPILTKLSGSEHVVLYIAILDTIQKQGQGLIISQKSSLLRLEFFHEMHIHVIYIFCSAVEKVILVHGTVFNMS